MIIVVVVKQVVMPLKKQNKNDFMFSQKKKSKSNIPFALSGSLLYVHDVTAGIIPYDIQNRVY